MCRIERTGSLVLLSRMQQAVAHAPSVVRIPSVPHGRPQRLDNRNSRASESKASSSLECSAECSRESTKLTFYCVNNHEQPLVGVRLLASTEQPVYRLSPLYPEGKGDLGESGGAPL